MKIDKLTNDKKIFVNKVSYVLLARSLMMSFLKILRSNTQVLCRRSGVFIVNSEHISHLVLVFLLLTLNM